MKEEGAAGHTLPTLSEIDDLVDGLLERFLGRPDLAEGGGASALGGKANGDKTSHAAMAAAAAAEDALPLEKRTCMCCSSATAGVKCALFPPRAPHNRVVDRDAFVRSEGAMAAGEASGGGFQSSSQLSARAARPLHPIRIPDHPDAESGAGGTVPAAPVGAGRGVLLTMSSDSAGL